MLLAGQHHRRAFDQGREILAGDVGVYAVAQGLKLVIEPELDALAVEFGVGVRPVPEPLEALRHTVV